jgi:hypothetical protein
MTNEEQLYMKYLERLRLKLIAKYIELGLRASGKYERELEAFAGPNKLIMYGASHSEYMEHGREPGKFPPRQVISDWIDTKQGLPSIFREKKNQFIFLISRKIAEEGITVPNEFNKGAVVSSVVDDFLANDIEEMLNELGVIYLRRIKSDVVQILRAA